MIDILVGLLIAITVILGLTSLTLNSLVIVHFYKKRQNIVPVLYLMLSGCDLFSGFTALIHSTLIYYMTITPWWDFDNRDKLWILSITYILTTVTSRASIYYSVMLAVTRSITITRPFYLISKTCVIICGLLCPLFWLLVSVYDINMMLKVYTWRFIYAIFHQPLPGECFFTRDCGKNYTDADFAVPVFILLGISYKLPLIIMMVCTIIQSYTLLKPTVIHQNITPQQKHVTLTIFIMAVVCIICNMSYLISGLIDTSAELIENMSNPPDVHYLIVYTVVTILPFLNSTLNPVILITRGNELRQYVRTFGRHIIGTITTMYGICTR